MSLRFGFSGLFWVVFGCELLGWDFGVILPYFGCLGFDWDFMLCYWDFEWDFRVFWVLGGFGVFWKFWVSRL